MGLSHNNLMNYYKLMFNMTQSSKWRFSITEVEAMIPYEMDLYTTQIKQKLEEEK